MIDLSEGVRIRYAVISAGVVLVLAYFGLRWWTSRGNSMPVNSWITVVVLLMIAAAVLVAGWEIRRYLRGVAGPPPSPQRARATLVAGQACALAGSVFTGWYLAQVFIHIGRVQQGGDRGALVTALVSFLSAAAVAVAGFVVQSWCRIPPEDDDAEHSGDGFPVIPA